MNHEEPSAAESAQIINDTGAALSPARWRACEPPDRARQITTKMAEQAATIQRLETLTAGLRDACKLANEANRDLAAANQHLAAQLNALRADASAGPFLVVTAWKEAATFDEARRKAEAAETLAQTPARVAVIARPVAVSMSTATTLSDPNQVADFLAR